MGKRSNWQEFQSILNQHHIKKLYHFTDKENLESIIKNGGLYSWADCEEKGIVITKPGGGGPSRDLDKRHGLEHYVRLSFTKRHPMMFVAQDNGRINDPVILEINPEILFEEDTLFSDKNAASNDAHVGGTLDDFKMIHFKSVKAKKHFDLEDNERPYFQAEILVQNFVPLSYITNIESFGIPIKQSNLEEKPLTTKVTKEDLEKGVKDEFGVIYSPDGKRLLKCLEDIRSYEIKPGAKIICDQAFYIKPENSIDPIQRNTSELTNIIIPNSVITIGSFAFYDCSKLTNVKIPNSVTKIENSAFYLCDNLTNVIIPESVTFIDRYAFSGCSKLSRLTVDERNPVYDSRNNCNAIIETASNKLICGNKDTIIPDSVSAIEIGAFSCCSSLESIEIPHSVIEIGDWAFEKCSNLTDITIGDSVTTIGEHAFLACLSLTSVIIPNSVTTIGKWAFHNCSGLTNVSIGNATTTIGDLAFSGCQSLKNVAIGNSVTSIGRSAFYGCNNLEQIIIPKGTIERYVRIIGDPQISELLVEVDDQPEKVLVSEVIKEHLSGRVCNEYDFIGDFHQGIASVIKDGQEGHINTDGNKVIRGTNGNYIELPSKFSWGEDFNNGIAKVWINGSINYVDDSFNIVICHDGNIIVPENHVDYIEMKDVYNNYIYVSDGKYGLLSSDGSLLTEAKYKTLAPFNKDLYIAGVLSRYIEMFGIIDAHDNEVLPLKYSSIIAYGGNVPFRYRRSEHDWYFDDIDDENIEDMIPENVKYWLIRNSSKFGLIDENGKIVILPEYSDIIQFEYGFFVRKDDKWGVYDAAFTAITEPKYDTINAANNGFYKVSVLTRVANSLNINLNRRLFGILDQYGREKLEPIYRSIEDEIPFHDGRYIINIENLKGLIDAEFNIIVEPQYQSICKFADGLAMVEKCLKEPNSSAKTTSICGAIDIEGNFLNLPELAEKDVSRGIEGPYVRVISRLSNGYIIIKKEHEQSKFQYYAVVDQNNRVIVPYKYHCIEEFINGMYRVSSNGKYGLLDNQFNELISPIYKEISIFEDLILVVKGYNFEKTSGLIPGGAYLKTTCGLLSLACEVILPCVYSSISFASPGLVWIKNENKKIGLATIDGKILIEPKYDKADSFVDGIAKVNNGGKWGAINLDGHEVICPLYESIEIDTTNKLYYVEKKISYYKYVSGILNESGKQIIKNSKGEYILASDKFDWQEDFDDNSQSVVYKNGITGIVNEKFQLVVHINSDSESKEFIIPEEYDWGYDSTSEFVIVQKDDKKGVIKSTGDLIVECIYHRVEILSENNKFLFSGANFKEGKSLSSNPLSPNYEWTVININGQRLFSSVFDEVTLLGHELLALKNDNGKYIIADFKGQIKTEALFDKVHPFDWPGPAQYGWGIPQKDEDVQYAIVEEANRSGVINSFGQVVINPKYKFIQVINSNQFFAEGVFINLQGERIASKGNISIPIKDEYEEAEIINNGLIFVKKDGMYGCINQIGTILIPIIYNSLTCYEDLIVAELFDESIGATKLGVINFTNEQIITFNEQYSEIIVEDNLILYHQNGCWGAYTLQGRLICNPIYDYIQSLTNNLIKVGKNSSEFEDTTDYYWEDGERIEYTGFREVDVINWGIIDINGKCILPLDYHYIENNNDGLIMIKHLEGKYGLLDMMGNTVLEPTYKSIGSFIDGLAIVSKPYTYYDNKDERYRTGSIYGVIDYSFKEVIPCDYKKIEYKRELGLFLTDVGYLSLDGRYIAELDGKHICINKEFLYCKPFNNGYAIAVKKTGEKAKYALINSKSENILPTFYDQIIRLQNGLYTLKIDDKWGLADTDGCIILPASYEYMGKVINNYVVIMKNEQWGLLSIETKAIIINTNASYLGPCMDGLCRINVGGNYSQSTKKVDGGRWGFVNPFGQIIIEPQYDLAYGFSEGFAAVKSCGKWGFINKEGINIVPCIYEYFEASYCNGRAHLSNDGTEFTFDNQGNIIESHEIRDYNNNYYDDD